MVRVIYVSNLWSAVVVVGVLSGVDGYSVSASGSGGLGLPAVLLQNAAASGVYMPQVGLGTGSYANNKPSDPACWSCPNVTYNAVLSWLKVGGRSA